MRLIPRLIPPLIALAGLLVSAPLLAQTATVTGRAPVASFSDPENLLYLDLSTGGRVVIWLRPDVAPRMVERIKLLARQHFYDGLRFHRVIDGFMAQGGDPKGDGTGGSTLPNLPAEFNYLPHVRGAVSAARSEKEDSANSQFFIVFQPRMTLDKKYTVFGRVIEGMTYVDTIERGEPPANPSRILHAWVAADKPPAYVAPPAAAAPALGAPITLPGATLPGAKAVRQTGNRPVARPLPDPAAPKKPVPRKQ